MPPPSRPIRIKVSTRRMSVAGRSMTKQAVSLLGDASKKASVEAKVKALVAIAFQEYSHDLPERVVPDDRRDRFAAMRRRAQFIRASGDIATFHCRRQLRKGGDAHREETLACRVLGSLSRLGAQSRLFAQVAGAMVRRSHEQTGFLSTGSCSVSTASISASKTSVPAASFPFTAISLSFLARCCSMLRATSNSGHGALSWSRI